MTIAERQAIADATENCARLSKELAALLTRLIDAEARLVALEDAATQPQKGGRRA